MLTVEITLTGNTLSDIQLAIEEAARVIAGGNSMGMGENETGSFHFTTEGEEEEIEDEEFDDYDTAHQMVDEGLLDLSNPGERACFDAMTAWQ